MKKNLLLMLPCIAAVATATFVGTKALKSNACETNALLMANVEALSNNEGPDQLPKHLNDEDYKSLKNTKVEVKFDSLKGEIKVNYERSCAIWHGYCRLTRRKDDICYPSLNKTTVVCDEWIKVE